MYRNIKYALKFKIDLGTVEDLLPLAICLLAIPEGKAAFLLISARSKAFSPLPFADDHPFSMPMSEIVNQSLQKIAKTFMIENKSVKWKDEWI